jgi:hypothetical protein
MLNAAETRKYHTQVRRLKILDAKISAMEKAAPYDHLTIPESVEAAQILADLKSEREAVWKRFPRGDVMCFFGDLTGLHYVDA